MPQDPWPEPKETISRFERLLANLARANVDFALVGGLAVILNGYPRSTLDADILVDDAHENLQRMLACLSEWGEGCAAELTPTDFPPIEGSVRVMEEFDLDIFTRMRGRTLADFRPRLQYLESDGVRIPYIGPADLIALKQDSWREKDQLDVAAMKEILNRTSGAEGL